MIVSWSTPTWLYSTIATEKPMRIDATVSSATQQRQPMVLRNLRFASRASSRDGIGTTGAVRTDSGGDGCGLTSRELGGLNMEMRRRW